MPHNGLRSGGDEAVHTAASQSGAAEPRMNVFLRSPAASGGHEPHPLARLLGLDVYGTSLLSRRAATEMGFVAVVLLVIFLFDFGAWSLLFNAVIHSAVDEIDLLTPVAVLAGTLFGLAVLTYERQFVTSDTSRGWLRLLLPMALRLAVIATSAVITAQPIELLFFRGPILHHTHKELVREHAAGLLVELEDLKARANSARELPKSVLEGPEAQQLQGQDQRIEEQSAKVRDLESRLVKAERDRRNWSFAESVRRKELQNAGERLAGLRAASNSGEALAAAASAYKMAQQRHADADRRMRDHGVAARNLKDDLDSERARLADLEAGRRPIQEAYRHLLDEAGNDAQGRVTALQTEGQEVRRWLQRLVALEPGAGRVSEEIGGVRYTFDPRAYDFFEQLRVLDDLRNARHPRWPGSTTEEIRDLAANFGVRDFKNCDSSRRDGTASGTAEVQQPCTDEEEASWAGFLARARLFHWSWLVVYGIALVIPCLVIATKLLLPAELKAYYSAKHQAAAGNPEAMSLLTVDRIVGNESRREPALET